MPLTSLAAVQLLQIAKRKKTQKERERMTAYKEPTEENEYERALNFRFPC